MKRVYLGQMSSPILASLLASAVELKQPVPEVKVEQSQEGNECPCPYCTIKRELTKQHPEGAQQQDQFASEPEEASQKANEEPLIQTVATAILNNDFVSVGYTMDLLNEPRLVLSLGEKQAPIYLGLRDADLLAAMIDAAIGRAEQEV